MSTPILTINVGSSSVKAAVFANDPVRLRRLAAASADGSGSDVVRRVLSELPLQGPPPAVIVHRIVHGGSNYVPTAVTPDVVDELRRLEPLAPEHLPPSLEAIAVVTGMWPDVRQLACFDTAFHHRMPDEARMYPLPRRFWDAGIRRYGFHGLSCEGVMRTLEQTDPQAAAGRIVIAHLGGGSSLTAVRRGASVDTTMGCSPAGGVMMATRSGDLDPGALIAAMAEGNLDADGLRHLVSRESGLKGVSGTTGDMQALLAAEPSDPRAEQAIRHYCYSIRKAVGAFLAVLGGVDTLVYTGGIGEHAPSIRSRILAGMNELGFAIAVARNERNDPVISPPDAPVTVRVVPSREDDVLASHGRAFLSRSS